MTNSIRLTQYSHGAGCGCKIAPRVLEQMLVSQLDITPDPRLLVGNNTNDDAAAYDLGNGTSILSTTDFFMPIVDDPRDFGRIAATNAISDIYAMGGTPMMAIAILGWPVNTLPAEIARQVIDGGREACREAGIMLAGGHSIDAPEPIFGLAVTGQIPTARLKQNNQAKAGDKLFLTKPLGIGILTTAEKKSLLLPEHQHSARDWMCKLNTVGQQMAEINEVTAMTDITGFGLLGHLLELCEGSQVHAHIDTSAIPRLPGIDHYMAKGAVPGGTVRNHASYQDKVAPMGDSIRDLLCDPQTSGGLLISVRPQGVDRVAAMLKAAGLPHTPIGTLSATGGHYPVTLA